MILAQAIRVIHVSDLARGCVIARQLDLALPRLDRHRCGAQCIQLCLAHRRTSYHNARQPFGSLDREVTLDRLVFAHGILPRGHTVQIRNVNRRRDGRRRYRRTTAITTTERRQDQQRQPPQRHRRHARAQRLPSLHPVRQHAHRIRPHRALRCVRIHIAVLVRAHQQVVRALAVANLAVVLVVVLDHQIGLLHITPFKRDVQVLAHALGRDVLRAVPRRLVREVVLHVAQRLDAHALATGSNAPFAPGNLHGLHRLAGVVDLQDDVLQAHDASLFPRQRLVFMGALRESCGGGSSSRATARSMTVR